MQASPSLHNRLAAVSVKQLSPEMERAARALWQSYEQLDIEVITTLPEAEEDLLASLPKVAGFDIEIAQMVGELVADMRSNIEAPSADHPLRLRFAYQGEQDLIDQLLSLQQARMVVVPVESDQSLHSNIRQGETI